MKTSYIYNNIFKIDRKIYELMGFSLPKPILYQQFFIFLVQILFLLMLNNYFFISAIQLFLWPAFFTFFLTQKDRFDRFFYLFIWIWLIKHFKPRYIFYHTPHIFLQKRICFTGKINLFKE